MNAALLLEYYARIADAPDAIARLRQFVLDLAVRGKLVEQDAGDDAATEVLMAAKVKDFSKHSELVGWAEAQLGQLLKFQYGKSLHAKERQENGAVPVFGSNGVVSYTHNALTDKPSIIVGRKGSAGALNLCTGPSWTTDVAYFVEAPTYFSIQYLLLALSALGLDQLGKGVKPGLSRSDAYALTMSVPPLAEQHRIVAKVDELMALCDQLEKARAEREAARDTFTLSTLAKLNAPDPETFRDDARFALANVTPLTSRPEQIKQLRQAILNLAVRGKLVEQDEGDEPASELLKQIAEEKARLVHQKVIKKSEVAEITPDETPFRLPANWQWSRLGDIGDWGAGSTPSRGSTELYGGGITWLKSGELNDNRSLAGSEETVSEAAVRLGSFRLNQPGDVLIAMYGATIGKIAILAEPAVTNQAVCGCTPFTGVANQYLFLFLLSQREQFHSVSEGGAQPNISKIKIINTLVPIPPLAEQHRIVAKVDKLMILCDQLEASITTGERTRSRLLKSVLHNALEPA